MKIGEIIDKYLKMKGISQQACADKMNVKRQFINQQLRKRKDLETEIIDRFSIALEHDFYADLSKQLPAEIRDKPTKFATPIEDAIIEVLMEKFPKTFK